MWGLCGHIGIVVMQGQGACIVIAVPEPWAHIVVGVVVWLCAHVVVSVVVQLCAHIIIGVIVGVVVQLYAHIITVQGLRAHTSSHTVWSCA